MSNNLWWQNGIFYHIYPQSFADSNADGWGDLQGIIQKLDYLADLGVDAVWLSPVYESPLVDGGYDISDYYSINAVYGTMEDFRRLLREAHRRNIRVIMDLVLNHTSDQHEWFRESRSSKDNPKRDWYIWQPPQNGKAPNNWRTNFGRKAWRFDERTGEYYYHSFFWQQPDLNWRNADMRRAMFEMMEFWLREGIDGFRLDVINLLIKDSEWRNNPAGALFSSKKAYNRNRPETYEILQQFRALLDKYPHTVSVGEIYTPPPGNPRLAASFVGNGSDMLHLAFDFSLVFSLWKASFYQKIVRNYYRHLPAGGWACFFLSNHDVGRSVNRLKFTVHKYKKARLQALLLLTLRGTPFIYYGDEIGMENAGIPRNKIQDLYGKLLYPFYKGRDGYRTPMQWNGNENAGFSTACPHLPVHGNHRQINLEKQTQDEYSIYRIYKKLIALRRQYPALQSGEITFLGKGNNNILAYTRSEKTVKAQRTTLLVLINFSCWKKKFNLDDFPNAEVLFSTHPRQYKTIDSILLQPCEGVILNV